ncbi:PHP domain-containing protein, partial [bacterium]|nr:PHP domain-containing protein [candidate division CSSED10-310 bacterium]
MRRVEADLHNHTTFSDGTLTPAELVAWGRECHLRALAVTDHDTIAGCAEALAEGRRLGIDVLAGIEVTLRFTRPFFTGSLHLLLYFDQELLSDAAFLSDLTTVVAAGRGPGLFKRRIQAINDYFGPSAPEPVLRRPLTFEEVQSLASNLTRRHIVTALTQFH